MGELSTNESRPLFPKGPPQSLKLLVLAVLSVTLMYADHKSNSAQGIRSTLSLLMEPIQVIAATPDSIQAAWVHFQSREALLDENETLQHEHLRLHARLQKLAALEAENERIRELLDSSNQIHRDVQIAEIVSSSIDPYRHMIRINKGSNDNIHKGQPLIDAHGIMGQVMDVTPTTATAILITDENQGIPVELNRSGLRTIAQGGGEGLALQLPFLPVNADIREGDLLVSSGMGDRYPAGYPVARIVKIDHQPGEHFLNVTAVPEARLHQGREVLLVMDDAATVPTTALIDEEATKRRTVAVNNAESDTTR